MDDEELAMDPMDIDLDPFHAKCESLSHGEEGVFRLKAGCAAMTDAKQGAAGCRYQS